MLELEKESKHVFVKLTIVLACVFCILNENKACVIIIRQLLSWTISLTVHVALQMAPDVDDFYDSL